MSELVADYIRVKDPARAEAFYRKVFNRAGVMIRSSVTFLDVDGHVFGLLDARNIGKSGQVSHPATPHLKLKVTGVRRSDAARHPGWPRL